jgi:hypothetical protein
VHAQRVDIIRQHAEENDAHASEQARLVAQIESQRHEIARRASLAWWLALPWRRAWLALTGKRPWD